MAKKKRHEQNVKMNNNLHRPYECDHRDNQQLPAVNSPSMHLAFSPHRGLLLLRQRWWPWRTPSTRQRIFMFLSFSLKPMKDVLFTTWRPFTVTVIRGSSRRPTRELISVSVVKVSLKLSLNSIDDSVFSFVWLCERTLQSRFVNWKKPGVFRCNQSDGSLWSACSATHAH